VTVTVQLSEGEAGTRAADTLQHLEAAFVTSECRSCGKKIKPFDEAYFDSLDPADAVNRPLHCSGCAVNLRYHRKRALMRGEPMPLTFTDVDERLAKR
jgi:hypothetical protein